MADVITLYYYGNHKTDVGFSSPNAPCGTIKRTIPCERFDYKWYSAVARLVYEFIQQYPHHTFEYTDNYAVMLNAKMTCKEIEKKVLQAFDNSYD